MRILRIPLLAMLVMIAIAGRSEAQLKNCDSITISNSELMRIQEFRGGPGDTVLMPFFLDNDSVFTAALFLFKFDTSKLTPIVFYDSLFDNGNVLLSVDTFLDIRPVGRFAIFNDAQLHISNLTGSFHEGRRDEATVSLLPDFSGDADTIPASPAGSVIFYMAFIAKPTLQHLVDIANFTFVKQNIFTVDNSVFPPDTTFFPGCNTGQLNEIWDNDFLGGLVDRLVYPKPYALAMQFITDTTPPKPVISFTANDSSITSGQTITLNWSSLNADSLYITENGTRFQSSFTLTGFATRSPTINPTTYKLVAWRGLASDSASFSVSVGGGGGGGGGNAPLIALNPNSSVYTINQGSTVSFTVTASNPSGGTGNITLTASNVPQNGAFAPTNPVVGVSPVSGTFSFTPDFNQSGSFSVTFSATNNNGTSTSSVVIVVQQLPVDRLFSTSAPNQKPVGGLRGTSGIKWPINMITNKVVYGVQFNMRWPFNYVTLDSFNVTDRIPDYVVYDNIGVIPGHVKVVTFGLNNEPAVTDTSTAILYANLTLDSNAIPWDRYWIYLDSAFESVDPDPNVASDTMKTDSGIVDVDNPGDVNLDRRINVADLVNIVGYIIGNFGLTPRQFATADIIRNDSVNVFDLVADINIIYGGLLNPSPGQPVGGEDAIVSLSYDEISSGSNGMIAVHSELHHEVAGLQFEVTYDPNSVTLGQPRMAETYAKYVLQYKDNGAGKLKLLMYTQALGTNEYLIKPGTMDLIDIPVTAKADLKEGDRKVRLTQALLSTSSAGRVTVKGVESALPSSFLLKQNYPNPFNPTTTIEFSVGLSDAAQTDVKLEVFNILGQQVTTLVDGPMSPGDYRIEWNATDRSGSRVATGIYLYRLSIGDQIESKKMLFLK